MPTRIVKRIFSLSDDEVDIRLLGRTVWGESVRGYTLPLDKLKAESPVLVCATCPSGSAG